MHKMSGLTRHLPWLLGLAMAPLLAGSVGLEGRAAVAFLFGLSLWLLATHQGGAGCSPIVSNRWLPCLALAWVTFSLVPLPVELVRIIDPQRAALANAFPLEPGIPQRWMPSSLAPAATLDRFAEIFLVVTAFWLARTGAADRRFGRCLAWTIALTIAVLGFSDLWLQFDPNRRLLGLWPDPAGHAAGTFPNRNHFANWIYVGALFVAGCLVRPRWFLFGRKTGSNAAVANVGEGTACPQVVTDNDGAGTACPLMVEEKPPVTSRGRAVPAPSMCDSASWLAFALGLILLFGFLLAIQTGSRGGVLALVAGLVAWVFLLRGRSRRPRRWLHLAGLVLILFVGMFLCGDYLLERMARTGEDGSFKVAIWRDSLALAARFPLLGTGTGTFATAFNHFKSFGGSSTFLHAENDLVELLVEQGLPGAAIILCGLFWLVRAARRYSRAHSIAEPELVWGAMAGLAAFAAHSLVEFVCHVPANAILAAALLGFVLGSRDAQQRPAVIAPPGRARICFNFAWCAVAFLLAAVQGGAWLSWQSARHVKDPATMARHLETSLSLWPHSTTRVLALSRLRASARTVNSSTAAESARETLNAALRFDPYNWQLRFERAWLDLSRPDQSQRGIAEAWETVHLNRRQPQIAIQFAEQLAASQPGIAWQFLQTADTDRADEQRQIYELAWKIEPDPALLWTVTPDTSQALAVLADFARCQKLDSLAVEARRRSEDDPSPNPR